MQMKVGRIRFDSNRILGLTVGIAGSSAGDTHKPLPAGALRSDISGLS